MPNCDCGKAFTDKDVCSVDMAGPDQYPYEGNMYLLCCPDCGCLTEIREDEIPEVS